MSRSVSGRLPESRLDLHHHMVLVQEGVSDRHLPLAEGVVEGVIDELRRNAEPRGRVAVDHHRGLEPLVLLIAAHIDQLGQRAHSLEHTRSPGVELRQVISLERILVEGSADPSPDAQILHRLKIGRGARHLGKLSAQPRDHLPAVAFRCSNGFRAMNMRAVFVVALPARR